MKTIAPAAMAAIEAGEAIVTGAVKITPQESAFVGVENVVLNWWQWTYSGSGGGNDSARLGLAFFDDSDVQIGSTVWADYANPTEWEHRELAAESPDGTAKIRVFIDLLQDPADGSFCDAYVDDISLTGDGVALTINNPGAEQVVYEYWTITAGNVYRGGVNPEDESPGETGNDVFAGSNAQNTCYQDISWTPAEIAEPICLWGGYGPITIEGDVYQGIGDRGIAQQTSGAIGGVAQGITLSLSGVEPEVIALLDADEIQGASVVLRRLIFASDGRTLLDYSVFDRGRVDTIETVETIGGEAAINIAVESAARGLGRSGARQRSDSDQRLISSTDGYFKNTAYAGMKSLYWGGKKPATLGG